MPPLRRGRDYTLSPEQPILRRNRRRRKRTIDLAVAEKAFWSNFDLDKFARDWRRGLAPRAAA